MAYCNPMTSAEYAVNLHGLKPPHRTAMRLRGYPNDSWLRCLSVNHVIKGLLRLPSNTLIRLS